MSTATPRDFFRLTSNFLQAQPSSLSWYTFLGKGFLAPYAPVFNTCAPPPGPSRDPCLPTAPPPAPRTHGSSCRSSRRRASRLGSCGQGHGGSNHTQLKRTALQRTPCQGRAATGSWGGAPAGAQQSSRTDWPPPPQHGNPGQQARAHCAHLALHVACAFEDLAGVVPSIPAEVEHLPQRQDLDVLGCVLRGNRHRSHSQPCS